MFMTKVTVGNKAPEFSLPANDDKNVTLSTFIGKYVVLYFYPKDDTSGCTKQAIAFTEHKDAFAAEDTIIIGMSPDTAKKHDKFIAKHELDLILASDEEKQVLEAYGVWVEKSMYGKKYMGVERSTFIINPEGEIAAEWRKVKVPGHVEKVLEKVKELKA